MTPEGQAAQVMEPPRGFFPVLRRLGPGMILAGSIVGSGELIATTLTGARAGFSFLWIILIGCIIKVFTQVEIARYSISSGKTTLRAFLDVPGGRVLLGFWMIMFFVGVGQLGGIVGGVGQALAISAPLTESGRSYNRQMETEVAAIVALQMAGDLSAEERRTRREAIDERIVQIKQSTRAPDAIAWCVLVGVATMIMLYFGRFGFIETFCIIMVMLFTFITIGNAFALQTQDAWSITWAGWQADGWLLPREGDATGSLAVALAAFGIIGVGAAEIVGYPYWCLEKGYGRWIGPRDESENWARRARGWIRIMQWDAWGSMVLYTLSTVAFYILGASVLHRIGLVPEKGEMVRTLGVMYEPVFGSAGKMVFLFGAFAVLFSTFFVANAQKARLLADVCMIFGRLQEGSRAGLVRVFSVLFPAACVTVYLLYKNPVKLVLISGVMQSLLLLPLGLASLYYRYAGTDRRLRPGRLWDVMLWLSVVCFAVIGLYLAWIKLFAG